MITQKEYELLKHYHATGYKWIAREKNGLVYAHKYKPFKDDLFWLANGLAYTIVSTPTGNIFKSITWEDEEPTKIDDLIRDYESHKEIVGEKVKVTIQQFIADWIEECKKSNLFFSNLNLLEGKAEVKNWIYEHDNGDDVTMKREEMVIKAYYDGYVVEKEKLYTVRLANGDCLYKFKTIEVGWTNGYSNYENDPDFQLTQSEIESVDPVLMKIAEEVE